MLPRTVFYFTGNAGVLLPNVDALWDSVLQRVMEEPVLLGKSDRFVAMRN